MNPSTILGISGREKKIPLLVKNASHFQQNRKSQHPGHLHSGLTGELVFPGSFSPFIPSRGCRSGGGVSMGNHGWGFPAPRAVLPTSLLTTASGVCSQAAVRLFREPTSAQSGSLESSLAAARLNSSLYPWRFGGR